MGRSFSYNPLNSVGQQTNPKGDRPMDLSEVKGKIELRQGDITEMEVDAIVNAANTDLILGAGVSGAIGRKGGDVIQQECDAIGSVPLGEAVATSAGALKARHVIHAASMEIGHFARDRDIEQATRSALKEADRLGARTVAFPAIGTGVAAFPADHCAEIMLRVAAQHLAAGSGLERVHIVLFDAETLDVFREALDGLEDLGEGRRSGRRSRRGRSRRGSRGGGSQGDSGAGAG
jgi:O-acetyl-ADP-ribose deacetylase (regulator of RNase III)